MLRRGFVDDERTVQMCEDGWLNLSVIPIIVAENHQRLSGCFFHFHSEKKGGGAYDFFRVDRDFDLRDRVHYRDKKEITAPSPKDSG